MKDFSDREIVITRTLNAPRALVFEAWTKPEHLIHWWGPNGFTNTFQEINIQPGGTWRFTMHGPDGVDYENLIVFLEVIAPERISYEHGSGEADDPGKFQVTVTFEEVAGKTHLTMRSLFPSAAMRDMVVQQFGAIEGGNQTVDRLEAHLVLMTPIVIERTFNVPADKIWRAISDKAEMKKWYFDLAEFEPVKGFEFEFAGGTEDGVQYLHKCTITEVVEGKKLSYSWRYDGYTGDSVVSFELFPEGDQTRLRLTHEGLATFPANNADFAKGNFVEGWTHIIGTALVNYLK